MKYRTRERIEDAVAMAAAVVQMIIVALVGCVVGYVAWRFLVAIEALADGGACQ